MLVCNKMYQSNLVSRLLQQAQRSTCQFTTQLRNQRNLSTSTRRGNIRTKTICAHQLYKPQLFYASLHLTSRTVTTQTQSTSTTPATEDVWAIGHGSNWNAAPTPVNTSTIPTHATQSTDTIPHISTFTPADTVDTAVGLAETAIDDRWAITKFLATPMEDALLFIHETTGLPWWATIIAVTIAARAALFPLAITQAKGTVAAINAKPEFAALQKQMSALQASRDGGMTPEQKMQHITQMRAIAAKHNYRAMDMIKGPLILAPLFIIFFSSLRHMCVRFHDTLSTGGTLWFPDLTIIDPFYGLPAISAITTVLAIHMGSSEMVQTDQSTNMRMLFMGLAVVGSIFMAFYMPSAVFLYWCINNVMSFLFGRLLANPGVRRRLGIPPMPKQIASSELTQQMKETMSKILPANMVASKEPEVMTLYKHKNQINRTAPTIQAQQTNRRYTTYTYAHKMYPQYTRLTK